MFPLLVMIGQVVSVNLLELKFDNFQLQHFNNNFRLKQYYFELGKLEI